MALSNRVTRMGDFSTIGCFWVVVNYGHFFENYRISPNVFATFFHGKKLCINFAKKLVGPCIFWAISSQIYLVTLLSKHS
jgi:hypothetical protein